MSAPAYDAAAADADLTALESEGIPAELKAEAMSAMASDMASAATTSAFMDEINALGASTRQMDQDIRSIYATFGEIDNAGFNFPRKLQPEWGRIKDKWTTLLWQSRDTASRIAANLKAFNKVTLPVIMELLTEPGADMTENIARARGILQRYANSNSPVAEVSMAENGGYSQAFADLQDEMNAFKNSYDNFTKAERARIEAQISSVKSNMNNIQSEIQNCEAAASRLSRCLGFTIFGTVVAAGISLFAFGLLGPLVAVGVLIVGAAIAIAKKKQLINYTRRANDLRGQLAQQQAQLNDLQNKLKLLEKCEAQLQANRVAIGNVAQRIGSLVSVWSTMRNNAIEFDNMLGDAETMEDIAEILPMMGLVQGASGNLEGAMRSYATQIDSSGAGRA